MKERKRFRKRVISLLVIYSMVITQYYPLATTLAKKTDTAKHESTINEESISTNTNSSLSSVSGSSVLIDVNTPVETSHKSTSSGYEVIFSLASQWGNAFQGSIIIKNVSNHPIKNWSLSFDMGHEITNIWNAVIKSHIDNTYVVNNAGYNKDIAPGQSISIGYQASYSGTINFPTTYELIFTQQEVELQKDYVFHGDGYDVVFKITNQWDGAFNGEILIKNMGEETLENWAIEFDFEHEISNIWNAVVNEHTGTSYKIKNVGSNQDIAPKSSVSFGFEAKSEDCIILPKNFELLISEEDVATTAYTISFKVTNDWGNAFNGEIYITNNTEETIEDWILMFDFDHQIERFWTAVIESHEGYHYVVKNAGYNANIKPGETIKLGFSGNPGGVKVEPNNFVLKQIVSKPSIEYVVLSDGKIEKEYLYRSIYPRLLMDGLSVENIKLADDFDGDGLTLAQEYEYDTNPFLSDSDEDGLNDYHEIFYYGSNPYYWDSDMDEMSDGTEVSCGLEPINKDSDNDGIVDGDEIIQQSVSINLNSDVSEVGTLPSIEITGKGDYSKKLQVTPVEHNKTILDIHSLIGTPFDFSHEQELIFDSCTLTFAISDEILIDNNLGDLAIAWFNEEDNALELLNTTYNYENNTISSSITHFSIYMVISIPTYSYDIDLKNESNTFFDSFDNQNSLNNWETYGGNWTIQNGSLSINSGPGYKAVAQEKNFDNFTYEVDMTISSTNYPSLGDAGVCFRVTNPTIGANAFDGYYLGLYPNSNIVRLYELKQANLIKQVSKTIDNNIQYHLKITAEGPNIKVFINDMTKPLIDVYNYYHTSGTVGLRTYYTNVSFDNVSVTSHQGGNENNGYWVRLSTGSVVKLDKDPSLGDETVDSDGDGIPDVCELKDKYKIMIQDPLTHEIKLIDSWSIYSNPAIKDTDGDGIEDNNDLKPTIYDTVIVVNNDEYIMFNTGNIWYNISCTSFDYMDNLMQFVDFKVDNPIPLGELSKIKSQVELNKKQEFSVDELSVIGLLNNEGSKLYMDNVSSATREMVFKRLSNRQSDDYKHNGILWWESWDKVPKGTKGGFFKGTVLSEADINFSTKIFYVCDVYSVLDSVAKAGALVIVIIVISEATPVVLANIQGITYYIKTFGVVEGFKMYQYLGVSNLPNSVITWVQWDVMDGDSSFDNIAASIQANSVKTKLENYLLNTEHPIGAAKAKWFELALGYNKSNMNELAKQIVFNENSAVQTAVTEYGTKYNQIISIVGTNGKVIDVQFVWIKNLDGYIRLVTGIPAK